MGSYKKLYDIKYIIMALNCTEVVNKGLVCIEAGHADYVLKLYLKAIGDGVYRRRSCTSVCLCYL